MSLHTYLICTKTVSYTFTLIFTKLYTKYVDSTIKKKQQQHSSTWVTVSCTTVITYQL